MVRHVVYQVLAVWAKNGVNTEDICLGVKDTSRVFPRAVTQVSQKDKLITIHIYGRCLPLRLTFSARQISKKLIHSDDKCINSP